MTPHRLGLAMPEGGRRRPEGGDTSPPPLPTPRRESALAKCPDSTTSRLLAQMAVSTRVGASDRN